MESGGIAQCILNYGTGGEWSSSFSGHFMPGEGERGTHYTCTRGWVGPRADLETVEKELNLLRLLGSDPFPRSSKP
jgi:hypothetical protein